MLLESIEIKPNSNEWVLHHKAPVTLVNDFKFKTEDQRVTVLYDNEAESSMTYDLATHSQTILV